jgi:hypothetical protein
MDIFIAIIIIIIIICWDSHAITWTLDRMVA